MQNDAYWRKRAAKRMYSYQQGADKAADTVAKAYAAASAHINNEMASIFRAFRENIGMTEQEARELLKQLPSEKTRRKLKELAKQIRDPEKRKKLESLLSAPAYAYRLRRFEELQADIDRQMSSLGAFEKKVTTEHYVDLANKAYLHSLFDLQKGTGLGFSFARMSASRVHEILAHNWSGRQYSERIWGRSKAVNQAVQDELLVQFMTGRSYNQTAREIESRMSVGAMEARRLVRTESTYIANSAELESYRACGMEKFRFCAVLDIRTSDICAAMDGRVFEVAKAAIGENVPPLHPWCRSTTVAHFEKTDLSRLERSARDPVTGKYSRIPGDMTYEDWKKQVDETHGGGTWETERKKVLNRAADRRQYDKYRETLGKKNLPKTLDGFQQLKYNKSKEWAELKWLYRGLNDDTIIQNANGQYVKLVSHTSLKYKPNTITQKVNKNGGIDRNYYDNNGLQYKQVSNNGHGHKKEEAFGQHGEHVHDYCWKDDDFIRKDARELSSKERKENNDIL